jgi:hypothetical protein
LKTVAASQASLRRCADELRVRDPEAAPSVKRLRLAARSTLLVLLAGSTLQYYFFDVHLRIMALPRVTMVAALP